ncbi:uncharacterised protein family HutD/Ves, partial [Kipferlia bialata]
TELCPVTADGAFSRFPGFQRILLPIEGAGFRLNYIPYDTHSPAVLSGGDDTHCALISGPWSHIQPGQGWG